MSCILQLAVGMLAYRLTWHAWYVGMGYVL